MKYLCWHEEACEEDAIEIYADNPSMAAIYWAMYYDGKLAARPIASGIESAQVCVRPAINMVSYEVHGDADMNYYAERKR